MNGTSLSSVAVRGETRHTVLNSDEGKAGSPAREKPRLQPTAHVNAIGAVDEDKNMKRKIGIIILSILALKLIDEIGARTADRILLANDAFFEKWISETDIIESGILPTSQRICFFDSIILLYNYRVCFMPFRMRDDPNTWIYNFDYTPPRPFLAFFFPGRSEDSLYFDMAGSSIRLKQIYQDGRIEDFQHRRMR